jgi:AraC family transcriptional regulator of adaptative response/methylated-DNA-[protein]-cysteine methyltransferase
MKVQAAINYNQIAEAIDYIKLSSDPESCFDRVSKEMHLSPSGFQQLFTEWAGITPGRFFQYLRIQRAQSLKNREDQPTFFENSYKTEPLSTGRAHDSFVTVEKMHKEEYQNGRQILYINYSFYESSFGGVIVASTEKGVCYMAFEDDKEKALNNLGREFPGAILQQKSDLLQQNALSIFQNDWSEMDEIKLHLTGTDFQLKIWKELLKIPVGELSTYKKIAEQAGKTRASRAVGTAIGSNSVAYIIPCHRIIRSSGEFGGFKWGGSTRKMAIIGWEAAKVNMENSSPK